MHLAARLHKDGIPAGILKVHETDWQKMVEDRNRTSHIYDEETAQEIYISLTHYDELFEALLRALQEHEQQRVMEERGEDSGQTE